MVEHVQRLSLELRRRELVTGAVPRSCVVPVVTEDGGSRPSCFTRKLQTNRLAGARVSQSQSQSQQTGIWIRPSAGWQDVSAGDDVHEGDMHWRYDDGNSIGNGKAMAMIRALHLSTSCTLYLVPQSLDPPSTLPSVDRSSFPARLSTVG